MIAAKKASPIAVVTASPPGENGVGQIYMRDLLRSIPDCEPLTFAVLREPSAWSNADREHAGAIEILAQKYESPKQVGPGKVKQLTAHFGLQWFTIKYARTLATQIEESIHRTGCQSVLIVLETPLLILLAESLVNRLRCRVTVLVWDHPWHVVTGFGHDGFTRKRLIDAFDNVVRKANAAITVADAMAQHLVTLNPGLHTSLYRAPVELASAGAPEPAERTTNDDSFVIGFAGSVTAPDELELLQLALDRLGWRVGSRAIKLRLFGKRFSLTAPVARDIEYGGFLPQQSDVIAALERCDLCFMPQPFSDSRRLVAEYSFPTKMSCYLQAGRPLLVVSPEYGSLSRFPSERSSAIGQDSPFGFHCQHADPELLAQLIARIATESVPFENAIRRARQSAAKWFSPLHGARIVRNALGLNV